MADNAMIHFEGDGFHVTISGASGRYGAHDLYMAALVHLIEQADTNFEEKSVGPEAQSAFYARVLGAVARHYIVTLQEYGDVVDEDRQSEGEILERLLAALRAEGHL